MVSPAKKEVKPYVRFFPIKFSKERLQQFVSRQDSARVRQRTDQLQPKADRPQVDLAEPSTQRVLTAEFRRFSQTKNGKEEGAKRIAST